MALFKKTSGRVALHGLGGLALGVMIAATLVFALATYARYEEPDSAPIAATALAFPDSQEKLEEMAAKMNPPEDVSPAAGKAEQPPAQ